jgi:hypothetical protein
MKASTVSGPEPLDLGFQLVGDALAVVEGALAVLAAAIFVAGRDMRGLDQHRRELAAAPFVAAGGERAERVAVIGLFARDDAIAVLADLEKVLPRQLDRRLDRFRAAGDEIDAVDALRRVLDQQIGEFLGRLGGEEAGMGKGDPSTCALIAAVTSASEWPRQETAAPPEPSK